MKKIYEWRENFMFYLSNIASCFLDEAFLNDYFLYLNFYLSAKRSVSFPLGYVAANFDYVLNIDLEAC